MPFHTGLRFSANALALFLLVVAAIKHIDHGGLPAGDLVSNTAPKSSPPRFATSKRIEPFPPTHYAYPQIAEFAMRVSTADFIKNFGAMTDRALAEPVTVTNRGRDRLVLMSVEEYRRLKQHDRRAVAAEELTEAELELIGKAEVPPEYAYLDKELEPD